MTAVNSRYAKELRQRFGYTATWLPNVPVRLGDIGTLYGHTYERIRTLADFGISFDSRPPISMTTSLEYASTGDVYITIKQKGELSIANSALAKADAGIIIEFGRAGAVVFQAGGCAVSSIEDQLSLADKLLAMYADGQWNRDYVVVTDVVHAEWTSVLVSKANAANIEFRLDADLMHASLADASAAGLQVIRSHNIETQIIAKGGLTPLFKAKGIRPRLIQPPRVVSRGQRPTSIDLSENFIFGDMDYEDFENQRDQHLQ